MRLCVLTTSFPLHGDDSSGVFVFDQCRHLAKHGIEVLVLAPCHYGSRLRERFGGVDVRRFRYFLPVRFQKLCYGEGMPTNLKNSVLARIQIIPFFISFFLNALFCSRKVDIIHCHWSPAGIVGLLAGKFLHRKSVVLMMHHGLARSGCLHSFIMRWLLRNVDCLMTNSSFTMKKALEHGEAKLSVSIPPGVDTNEFRPRRRNKEFYKRIDFDGGKPLLFSMGTFIECKGFRYLIEAMDFLVWKMGRHEIQLMIGGGGSLKTELKLLVAQKNLEENIRFLGYIPHEETPVFYSHSDIYISPSIVDEKGNTEGLGMTLIEANSCCVPCIGSKVGGIIDVIEDGTNGFLVEEKNPEQIAERVRYLIDNPRKRREMGEAGRRIAKEKFDSEVLAKRLINLYGEILRNME